MSVFAVLSPFQPVDTPVGMTEGGWGTGEMGDYRNLKVPRYLLIRSWRIPRFCLVFAVTVVLAEKRKGEGEDVRIPAEGKEGRKGNEREGSRGGDGYIKILEIQESVDPQCSPLE